MEVGRDRCTEIKPPPGIGPVITLAFLSNNQIIHIGDNPSHDVIGANESGMFSCWLKRPKNWYKEIKDVEPNFIISNLLELKNLNK